MKNVKQEHLLELHKKDYIRNNARICASHFEDKYFTSTLKERLHKIAVPFDPLPSTSGHVSFSSTSASFQDSSPSRSNAVASNLPQETNMDFTMSEDDIDNPKTSTPKPLALTPKTKLIKRLRCDVSKLRKQLVLKDEEIGTLKSIESKVTAVQFSFICKQIEFSVKDPRGRRWSPQDKCMALNIYLQSKAAYLTLKQYFAFPCINTLKTSVGNVAKDVGFCPILKKAFQQKVEKMENETDKFCTLVFDEMSIKNKLHYNAKLDCVDGWESAERENGPKQIATQALVFMIRGITHNWKQVIKIYYIPFCINFVHIFTYIYVLIVLFN